MSSWQDKVHRAIGALCKESYLQAGNKLPISNSGRRKHKPYAVPEVAEQLIDCLNTDDEERAKAIMLYDYDVGRTLYAK